MKKIFLSSVFVASFALLAACGDDSSSGPAEESSSSIEAEEESSSGGETSSSSSSHSEEEDGDESSSSHSEDVSPESSEDSGDAKSSSSSEALQSSSSNEVAEVKPSGYYKDNCPAGHTCTDAAPSTYLKSGITYGEILDTRDYQVYKVVTIGTQTWMAQNLNYAPDEDYMAGMGEYAWSGCYGEDGYDDISESNLTDAQVAENCSKYGRLYTWEVAMDKAGCGYENDCNNSYEGSQGICPEGWHLPSSSEWQSLISYVGNEVGSDYVGTALKTATGWFSQTGDDADRNAYGFSALPAGLRYGDGDFGRAGNFAYFWSSSEDDSNNAYYMFLAYDNEHAYLFNSDKYNAFSVRCVQNN